MKTAFFIVFNLIYLFNFGQTKIEGNFYKDATKEKRTSELKASYKEIIITTDDGTKRVISYEKIDPSKNHQTRKYIWQKINQDIDHCIKYDSTYNVDIPKDVINGFYKYLFNKVGYPLLAKENNIEGTVELLVLWHVSGEFEVLEISKTVHSILDHELFQAVSAFKASRPIRVNGEPTDLCITVPYRFNLM